MTRIDLEKAPLTPFQKRVYHLLYQIPAGRVTTYGSMARALKTSPRAVGNALRNNIYAPEIPCHRCVATGGYVNGYDGEVIKKTSFSKAKGGAINGKASHSKAKGAKANMQSAAVAGSKTNPPSGINIKMKLDLLNNEGVQFDSKGMLLRKNTVLFDGPWDVV